MGGAEVVGWSLIFPICDILHVGNVRAQHLNTWAKIVGWDTFWSDTVQTMRIKQFQNGGKTTNNKGAFRVCHKDYSKGLNLDVNTLDPIKQSELSPSLPPLLTAVEKRMSIEKQHVLEMGTTVKVLNYGGGFDLLLISHIWEEQNIPLDLRGRGIMVIFKKKDKLTCNNSLWASLLLEKGVIMVLLNHQWFSTLWLKSYLPNHMWIQHFCRAILDTSSSTIVHTLIWTSLKTSIPTPLISCTSVIPVLFYTSEPWTVKSATTVVYKILKSTDWIRVLSQAHIPSGKALIELWELICLSPMNADLKHSTLDHI